MTTNMFPQDQEQVLIRCKAPHIITLAVLVVQMFHKKYSESRCIKSV